MTTSITLLTYGVKPLNPINALLLSTQTLQHAILSGGYIVRKKIKSLIVIVISCLPNEELCTIHLIS